MIENGKIGNYLFSPNWQARKDVGQSYARQGVGSDARQGVDGGHVFS